MDQVSQIKEKIDIVSFISEYIPLKKAGRNFKANCPFHGEKTPSLVVSPERQLWHCFGCGLGGSVYDFLMQYEKMEFAEALRFLAKRAGITLETSQAQKNLSSKKELLYEMNSFAKEYYHYVLTKLPAGEKALAYLLDRGVSEKIIETFRLGFSPATDRSLVTYLLKKKQYKKEDIVEAGLAFSGRSGLVDFFRGRVMFPLIDHRDNVVGFSGRVLEAQVPSKYINTRETPIYHKSEHVFGLNITKDAIRREKQAIIVEGEFDVISCFSHGIANVVAVKGTALTEGHVSLLYRYADKITFCFDDDKAGFEAIKKSLAVVERKGLTPSVIAIPGGKDPDEALKTDSGAFKKAVKEDMGVYDYLLAKLVAKNDIATATGKQAVVGEFLSLASVITNEVVKEHYLRQLSNAVDTSLPSIQKEFERVLQRQTISPTTTIVPQPKAKRAREEVLEEYLLALLIQSDDQKKAIETVITILSDVITPTRASQKLLSHLIEHLQTADQFDVNHFGEKLPQELVACFTTSSLFLLPQFSDQSKSMDEITKTATSLRTFYLQEKLTIIAEKMRQQERDGNESGVVALQEEYATVTGLLKKK